MEASEKEDPSMRKQQKDLLPTGKMKRTWEPGNFLYSDTLHSRTDCYSIIQQHNQSRYTKSDLTSTDVDEVLSCSWGQKWETVIGDRMKNREEYRIQLHKLFETNAENIGTEGNSPKEDNAYEVRLSEKEL